MKLSGGFFLMLFFWVSVARANVSVSDATPTVEAQRQTAMLTVALQRRRANFGLWGRISTGN
jgi:hypothetical protein